MRPPCSHPRSRARSLILFSLDVQGSCRSSYEFARSRSPHSLGHHRYHVAGGPFLRRSPGCKRKYPVLHRHNPRFVHRSGAPLRYVAWLALGSLVFGGLIRCWPCTSPSANFTLAACIGHCASHSAVCRGSLAGGAAERRGILAAQRSPRADI